MTLHGRSGRTDEASGVLSSIWNNQGAQGRIPIHHDTCSGYNLTESNGQFSIRIDRFNTL